MDKEQVQAMSPYLQRMDQTEEQVVALMRLGYSLWMITPVTQELRKADGRYISLETKLMYHFIKRKEKDK
jgi:Holliday junction resolvasome RuvABC DNA-binding subunit